jgi:hypothetical protein
MNAQRATHDFRVPVLHERLGAHPLALSCQSPERGPHALRRPRGRICGRQAGLLHGPRPAAIELLRGPQQRRAAFLSSKDAAGQARSIPVAATNLLENSLPGPRLARGWHSCQTRCGWPSAQVSLRSLDHISVPSLYEVGRAHVESERRQAADLDDDRLMGPALLPPGHNFHTCSPASSQIRSKQADAGSYEISTAFAS